MTQVMLRICEEGDEGAVLAFSLPMDQLAFTALPADSLSLCREDSDRHPIVITADCLPVGFFVLHVGQAIAPFTDNPRAVLLRALLMDQIHQGRGYAAQAMRQVPTFVRQHFPESDEIVLAVNHGNAAASRLYRKSGFLDLGLRRMGPKGEQSILHYPLKTMTS